MARRKESLVYLDTHIVVWLYAGLVGKFAERAKEAIETNALVVSQMARLELQYLYEIGRIKATPLKIIRGLSKSIDLKVSTHSFQDIVNEALKINWTRDVFDRLLVGEAQATKSNLVTADQSIQKYFKGAVW